jgi:hypothetical protein
MTSTGAVRASVAAAALAASGLTGVQMANAATGGATGITVPPGFHVSVFGTAPGAATLPDDITRLGDRIFVGFQNGVGTMGEPSPSGQTRSTVVEYSLGGRVLDRWNVTGKVDGLGADPDHNRVVATVNEDGDSSLYTITPDAPAWRQVAHYTYSPATLPHGGGTDSVVARDGELFISASNPSPDANGTTFSGPAVYSVTLAGGQARWRPVFDDNATATDVTTGKKVTLNLSDADSSENVPWSFPRFGGDFVLDSQGDGELVFVHTHGSKAESLSVLNLTTQVDDSSFATTRDETLYVVDAAKNEILAITGPFTPGQVFSAVPSDSTALPGTLGRVDLRTGQVTPFATGFGTLSGLLFVVGDCH